MHHSIYTLCRCLAWFGGLVLVALAILSTASIAGRALSTSGFGLGPIPGDFELVEAGTALAIFCFLPWCHLRRAHATVDLFWNLLPASLHKVLNLLTDTLMFVVWALLIWRMGVGMLSYRESGDTSFILQMPVWWGYAASFVPAVLGLSAYALRMLERFGVVSPPTEFTDIEGNH